MGLKLEYASPQTPRERRPWIANPWRAAFVFLVPLWIATVVGQSWWYWSRGFMRFDAGPASLKWGQTVAVWISQSPVLPMGLLLLSGPVMLGLRGANMGVGQRKWFDWCVRAQTVLLALLVLSNWMLGLDTPLLLSERRGRIGIELWSPVVGFVEVVRGVLFSVPLLFAWRVEYRIRGSARE